MSTRLFVEECFDGKHADCKGYNGPADNPNFRCDCDCHKQPTEDERVKEALNKFFSLLAKDSNGQWCFNSLSRDATEFQNSIEELNRLRLLTAQPAPIDFSCGVCGVQCVIAPDPPARAVCPEHCEDHDYEHDRSRAGSFCIHCDEQRPEDWDDD